jgi:hypothetical protein
MNQKIQCLIDGGFISINDVLEHAGYLENQMDEYYKMKWDEWHYYLADARYYLHEHPVHP